MNIDRIHSLIQNPNVCQADDLPLLYNLSVKYPYAQLFSILYLKTLQNTKDIRFEEELTLHAFKITDREFLYELMYNYSTEEHEKNNQVNKQFENTKQQQDLLENKNLKDLNEIEIQLNPTTEIKENTLSSSISEQQIEIEENVLKVVKNLEKIEEKPTITTEYEEKESIKEEIDDLEKSYLANILSATYSLEKEEKKEEISENLKINLEEKRSFNSWLKTSKPKSNLEEKKQLIENFILQEPKITSINSRGKVKSEFYSAPKKAKESINENKLMYSETLANIFAIQGNFPKAIHAFEQLILTFPEKKRYFAQKIKELQQKINK